MRRALCRLRSPEGIYGEGHATHRPAHERRIHTGRKMPPLDNPSLSEICYDISDMRDLTLKVLKRAKAVGLRSALTPKAFVDLGSRAAVDQALSRLSKAGKIRRISRGVYDVDRKS